MIYGNSLTGSEVQISRLVDCAGLTWPTGEERISETLGGNRDYFELERIGWNYVKSLIAEERELLVRLNSAEDRDAAHVDWLDSTYDDVEGGLLGLDLGTNALTAALKASRCLPFYSCNGGAFGGHHNDRHPVVAFYCRPQMAELILAAADQAGAGLENNHSGGITAYGETVDVLVDMASALYSSRRAISHVRLRAEHVRHPATRTSGAASSQGELF